jgi:hypothetical protein
MTKLSVNAAELSANTTELSADAVEFWFFERLLFLSRVKQFDQILANFTEFFRIFQKIDVIDHLRIFCSTQIFKH